MTPHRVRKRDPVAASEALSGGAPGSPAQVWVEAHAAGCGPGRPRVLCTQAAGLCTRPRALCSEAAGSLHPGRRPRRPPSWPGGNRGRPAPPAPWKGAGCAGTARRRLAAGSDMARTQLSSGAVSSSCRRWWRSQGLCRSSQLLWFYFYFYFFINRASWSHGAATFLRRGWAPGLPPTGDQPREAFSLPLSPFWCFMQIVSWFKTHQRSTKCCQNCSEPKGTAY